jgi:hypothetical protein
VSVDPEKENKLDILEKYEIFKLVGKLENEYFYLHGIYIPHWHDPHYTIKLYLSNDINLLIKYTGKEMEEFTMLENIQKL